MKVRRKKTIVLSADSRSDLRVRSKGTKGSRHADSSAKYVIYWIQAFRRLDFNHAFQHAVGLAQDLGLPLLIYESLRLDYPWASRRFHCFILEGACDTATRARELNASYLFFLERSPEAQKDTSAPLDYLVELAKDAAHVVTDDFPCFIAPSQTEYIAERIACPLTLVDSNGVVPLALFEKEEFAARTIRPKIHKVLPEYYDDARARFKKQPRLSALKSLPKHDCLLELPEAKTAASGRRDFAVRQMAKLSLSGEVQEVSGVIGGRSEALRLAKQFFKTKLVHYDSNRNDPANPATSQLSAYLHFGFISAIELALMAVEHHQEATLGTQVYLEELIVRRELAFNFVRRNPSFNTFAGLPKWCQETLLKHAKDRRPYKYSLKEFEQAKTHDELWNAAQRELVETGKIHGYVRMYWGKMFLEWSENPKKAFEWCIHLNNKYALDGRNPNSYAGVAWCFGKHDRPWGPERKVFGLVRYMTLAGMHRKFDVDQYIGSVCGLSHRATS